MEMEIGGALLPCVDNERGRRQRVNEIERCEKDERLGGDKIQPCELWHSLRCSIPPSRPPPTAMATSPPRPLHRLPSDGGARSRTGEHRQGGSSLKTPPPPSPPPRNERRAPQSTDGGRGKGEVTYEHTREAVRSLDQEKGLNAMELLKKKLEFACDIDNEGQKLMSNMEMIQAVLRGGEKMKFNDEQRLWFSDLKDAG
uniref:Disease resistance N-terminal domain-containing protein n=1 Tax=Oryza glumipatula TaxID=40148 RepID=A0A0E0BCH5_9ORYZ